MVGQKFANYSVIEKIGAGGMGEVYRARDEWLGRDVAIKVLPPSFLSLPDRVARFDREAKILATFNHPNIASLYGVEDVEGVRALVMELVEGPALADRLQSGPIPLDEALVIARQIIDALEAAHDRGIVHRDLKPANIKLTLDDRVKVLDFGLARALEDDPASSAMDQSPTLSAIATKTGIILGTAAYMSPEQAKAKPCDRRADVWAFGVVLYEMLAGRPLYAGETASEVLAAVIKEEPDWSALPADTPPAIRKLLRRCLTKDPKRRLQSIGEARIALEEYAAAPGTDSVMISGVTARPPAWRKMLPWALAGVFLLAAAVSMWSPWRAAENPAPPIRLNVDVGADAALNLSFGAAAVSSPDGTLLAFAGRGPDQNMRLFLRRLDRSEAHPLPGTEGAVDPFFSPDGQWIGYFAEGSLRKVAVQGGASVSLCPAQGSRGGSWSEDGTIVFTPRTQGGLFRVSSAGGAPVQLTTPDKERGEITHRWPQVLPGGKAVVFTASRLGSFEESRILAYSLESRVTKEIHVGGMYPRYVPARPGGSSGFLLYIHEGTVFAAPFELQKLEMTAPPVPVLEGVTSNTGTGGGQLAFSDSGTLVFVPGSSAASGMPLLWLDAQGKLQPLREAPANYTFPRFSPEGKRLAVSIVRAPWVDIYIYDWERDTMSRLTVERGRNWAPVWTPDGLRIAYRSDRDGPVNIYWQRADGTGPVERLTESKYAQTPFSWSPDGKLLALVEENPSTGMDIWLLPMEGSQRRGWKPGTPRVFLNGPYIEGMPAISPDGRWLAYGSTETGNMEVYVQPISGSGGKWQVSSAGGGMPRWSSKKNELFYRSTEGRIMVVDYSVSGASFLAGRPRVWSETTITFRGAVPTYDLHPDGKRFVVVKDLETVRDSGSSKVTFLFNFREELRRRISAGQQPPD